MFAKVINETSYLMILLISSMKYENKIEVRPNAIFYIQWL